MSGVNLTYGLRKTAPDLSVGRARLPMPMGQASMPMSAIRIESWRVVAQLSKVDPELENPTQSGLNDDNDLLR